MASVQILCFVLLLGLSTAASGVNCSSCQPMWTFFNGNCYRYFGTGKPFLEAELYCLEFSQMGQAHLASVTNTHENTLIKTIWKSVRGTTPDGLWLGLHDMSGEGNYTWTDGSKFEFTDWAVNQPDNHGGAENCVEIRRADTAWNDFGCNQELAYICKMTIT